MLGPEITVLIKEPGKPMRQQKIENRLEAFQEAVGGYIEIVPITESILMIVNEEGKMKGLETNFVTVGDVIVGPAVFVGSCGDDFRSLSRKQIEALRFIFEVRGCAV